MKLTSFLALTIGLVSFGTADVRAQAPYPSRPVRIVVPFAAGGASDLLGRIAAQGLSERLGQSFVFDNKPGSSGNVGTASVSTAEPDGYTLLVGTIATMSVNNHLYANPGFDAAKDFAPIGLLAELPNIIEVTNDLPVKSLKELIAYAQANPGKLNYGSTGVGGTPHLVMEIMKNKNKLDIVHVPYRGSAPIQTAVMGGEIQTAADNITTVLPLAEGGKVRALAITSKERLPAAPNIPTVVELGHPELLVTAWFGLLAPAKTPPAIIEKINAALEETLRAPDIKSRLQQLGAIPLGGSADKFRGYMEGERKKWGDLIKEANIRLD